MLYIIIILYSIIAGAFEGRATGIQRKHLGTLKELAWEEEYNVTMGGG